MTTERLGRVRLFASLSEAELELLASRVEERQVPAGKPLVKEGEVAPGLFLVLEGRVRLNVRDDLSQKSILDTVEAGDVFGELSLVTDEPAFIWAETLTPCRLGVLNREDFHRFLHQNPSAALDVFQILGRRTVRLEHAIRASKSRDAHEVDAERMTFGDRVSDGFAALIGSWPFILVQTGLLALWVFFNVIGWIKAWDPYPFILLNLALSFQAAYAGPIIMMSQNRQGDKDRLAASIDHQVNLKSELELSLLSRKVEDLEERLHSHLEQVGVPSAPAGSPQ